MTWTLPTNITDITSFMGGVNNMIGGDLVAFLFMFMIFAITFMGSLGRFEVEKSLMFASWVTAIVAGFTMVIFHVSATIVLIPIFAFLLSLFLVWRS